jgi:hypothetical protein
VKHFILKFLLLIDTNSSNNHHRNQPNATNTRVDYTPRPAPTAPLSVIIIDASNQAPHAQDHLTPPPDYNVIFTPTAPLSVNIIDASDQASHAQENLTPPPNYNECVTLSFGRNVQD